MINKLKGGIFGLLVGDALGVPYEFHNPEQIPPFEQIDMIPPKNFRTSYPNVKYGTWSDDGAQALCLLDSLICKGIFDLKDFSDRVLASIIMCSMQVSRLHWLCQNINTVLPPNCAEM